MLVINTTAPSHNHNNDYIRVVDVLAVIILFHEMIMDPSHNPKRGYNSRNKIMFHNNILPIQKLMFKLYERTKRLLSS